MNADLDHHVVKFARGVHVERADVSLNDALYLVVRCLEYVDDVCKKPSACQESAGIGINNE